MRISLEEAAKELIKGQVVAVPTETVYGLAASIHHPEAIQKIFSLKGRPLDNPLIVHLSEWPEITPYIKTLPFGTKELALAFWPGPLTLVLEIFEKLVPFDVRAGLPTAAFRIPHHPLTKKLLKLTGPLVMPSANKSGRPSSTQVKHIEEDFGQEFPILDGGACQQGVESTILGHVENHWVIFRLGAIAPEMFLPIIGEIPLLKTHHGQRPVCPGQQYRHYSPQAKLTLVKSIPEKAEGIVLGFEDRAYPLPLLSLGNTRNPQNVAQNLYSALRQLDIEKISQAWVDMDFPREGLWLTIAERLQKAASIN